VIDNRGDDGGARLGSPPAGKNGPAHGVRIELFVAILSQLTLASQQMGTRHDQGLRKSPAAGPFWFRVAGCCGVLAFMPEADRAASTRLGLPERVHACLFDLDGVLTDTASVHATAWKQMFDAFLADRAERSGEEFVPFDIGTDYPAYVDGKRRQDGTRSFLASRGIDLPEGSADDDAEQDTINGLGTRKNALVQQEIATNGVTIYEGSVRYLRAVRDAGLRVAVVSSSANTEQVLRVTGLEQYVEARVDAQAAISNHLAGKPAPDTFLAGARALGATPDECVVFEDAIAGVQAGHAGKFALVVGVDRVGHGAALSEHGADVVVTDLDQLLERS
jgi:beta-phosphoglucomutase family hydrolase